MKKHLLAIYPLFKLYRWCSQFLYNWRYHAVVKNNGILLYEESSVTSLHRDLLAIDLYKSLRGENDWMPGALLPVGGAADYKILYLIARLLVDHGIHDIIEFGAGQSSILLSGFAKHSGARVVTIEHDAAWAERVASRTQAPSHQVIHCPLTQQRSTEQGNCAWYDLSNAGILGRQRFELLIVDGPVGLPRYSRMGIVDRFSELHADEWVVLWDDLHRVGEMQTFALFLNRLRDSGVQHRHVVVNGIKRIGIIYTRKFESVASYF